MRQLYHYATITLYSSHSMNPFRYKADILPVTLFVLYFILDIFMYLRIESIVILSIYLLTSIIVKVFICAWNHHHQHVQTFTFPLLNRFLEVIYAFQTGTVGYGWVLHHNLGHHMHYLDQSQDESAWKSPTGKRYHPFVYTLIVTMTAYYRSCKVGKKFPQIQRYFIRMCVLQLVLLSILIAYEPLAGTLIFLVPMITGLFLTVYTTYHHHSGLESTDHHQSSYNIIEWWYNLLTGNLGFHTAHHMKGSLHWSKLPEYHKEIESKIDPKYYKKYKLFWYETAESL